jgi:hypothetical protein
VVGERVVEITPGGRVLVDGEAELTIDAAGRIFDENRRAVALWRPDGTLLGRGDEPLGWVAPGPAGPDVAPGAAPINPAAPPGPLVATDPEDHQPWLELYPTGEVARVHGEIRRPFGVWLGCDAIPGGPATCLVVSQLIGLELRERQTPGVGLGIGVGIGVQVR